MCDDITSYLRADGWPALAIHGDKQQSERDWVLKEFKAGKSPIMVATDVAARGIGMYIFWEGFLTNFLLFLGILGLGMCGDSHKYYYRGRLCRHDMKG